MKVCTKTKTQIKEKKMFSTRITQKGMLRSLNQLYYSSELRKCACLYSHTCVKNVCDINIVFTFVYCLLCFCIINHICTFASVLCCIKL